LEPALTSSVVASVVASPASKSASSSVLGLSLVNLDGASIDLNAVQHVDGVLGLVGGLGEEGV